MDTPVGVGGSRLSGGQKQRIAIARVGKAPQLLLLGEATSALDNRSEGIVQVTIDALQTQTDADSRMTVSIAHRLSTIRVPMTFS